MIRPTVLLDADGVLLNWKLGFVSWLRQHHNPISSIAKVDEHAEDIESKFGLTSQQTGELIGQFHLDPSFENLDPLEGAVSAVKALAKWCSLSVITACGTNPVTQEMRQRNLQRHFGPVFEQVWCTDSFGAKSEYLQMYEPGWWVEDHAFNAQLGLQFSHQCLLIDAPYNQGSVDPRVMRVHNLVEAAYVILSQLRSSCPQLAHSWRDPQ